MSLYLGTQLLAGVATNTIYNAHDLFDHKWTDHLLTDMAWLRADTFSWQDGTVYSNAYNHLVADYNNIQIKLYAWGEDTYTTSPEPSVGDTVYRASGASWGFAVSDVASDYSYIRAGGVAQLNRNPSIDIKTKNTETIGSYTITYYLATDGHKICLPDQETTVQNIYTEFGVAWYYILDTTNQRFKLPRTKYGFVGLRDTVGKYVPESLPNIKANGPVTILSDQVTFSGAFYKEWSAQTGNPASGSYRSGLGFDASLSSSTYQDSAPVQQRATQMYLYFYVGQFSQTAIEQTAGLNSELFNGKLDLDASNLSTDGKSLISGIGMPSDTYENLTPVHNTTYTAPANGFYSIASTGDTSITLVSNNTDIMRSWTGSYSAVFMPVKKGATIRLEFAGTPSFFRFIYAEGEV